MLWGRQRAARSLRELNGQGGADGGRQIVRGSPGQATRLYDLPKPRALPLHAFCPPLPLIGGGANIYKSPVFVKAQPNRLAILICLHVSHYFETSRVCVKHFIKVSSWLSLLTLQGYKRKSKIKGVFSLSYWKKNESWSNLIKNLFARSKNIQYWYNFCKNYCHCLGNDVKWHEPLFYDLKQLVSLILTQDLESLCTN